MPEIIKCSQGTSPMAKVGGGDISEREVTRERYTLQTTTPARVQPAKKKQLQFSVPVNKFTARPAAGSPSPHLARLRSCLDQYSSPPRPPNIGPKAVSMEDLTPTKRIKIESRCDDRLPTGRSPAGRCGASAEAGAAARVARFILVHAWRRRRQEARCLRKTLEFQVSCSERLRIQVSALKSLLDSDNAKVRLAITELERLKRLLHDKEIERQLLEREKIALEGDVSAAEDKASEMSIGWHNCRNELEGVRAAGQVCEQALSLERAAAVEARAQRDQAYARLAALEEELAQHESLLSDAEAQVAALRRETDEKQRALELTGDLLAQEREARSHLTLECGTLHARATLTDEETDSLRHVVLDLQYELARRDAELRAARVQLQWWPLPFTRMPIVNKSQWPRSETVVWSLWCVLTRPGGESIAQCWLVHWLCLNTPLEPSLFKLCSTTSMVCTGRLLPLVLVKTISASFPFVVIIPFLENSKL